MSTFVSTVAIRSLRFPTPVSGGPTIIQMISIPCPTSISAVVGGGGSLLVEYTLTPTNTPGWPGTAVWTPWALGTGGVVSSNTFASLVSPIVAMRVTATGADGSVEVCG